MNDWLDGNPEWTALYRGMGNVLFSALDQFFDANPTPAQVQKQAVTFLAKSYRYRPGTPSVPTVLARVN